MPTDLSTCKYFLVDFMQYELNLCELSNFMITHDNWTSNVGMYPIKISLEYIDRFEEDSGSLTNLFCMFSQIIQCYLYKNIPLSNLDEFVQ